MALLLDRRGDTFIKERRENQKSRKVIWMITSIAAMSMSMHTAKLQQSVDIAMLKDTMDQQAMAMEQLVQVISNATLGGNIDTYA